MRAVKVFIVMILLSSGLHSQVLGGDPGQSMGELWEKHPFWLRQQNIDKLEAGQILVASSSHDKRSWMRGSGHVKSSLQSAFAFAQDYQRLAKIPEYFTEVHFEDATGILKMQLKLPFRDKQETWLQLHTGQSAEQRWMEFIVLKGFAKGTKGVLLFEDLKRQNSEIRMSIQAVTQRDEEFSWITNLGVEAALKHVANSMRGMLEDNMKVPAGTRPKE